MKKVLSLFLTSLVVFSLLAQEKLPVYKDKITAYSKIAGQEGRNINISLALFSEDSSVLYLSGYSPAAYFDTILVHELNVMPVLNDITTKLIGHNIGSAGQTYDKVLESQSVGNISTMILKAHLAVGSAAANKKDPLAAFSFKTKIPLFISDKPEQIKKLYEIIGFNEDKRKADSIALQNKKAELSTQILKINEEIAKLIKDDPDEEDSDIQKSINDKKAALKKADDALSDLNPKIMDSQSMINGKDNSLYFIGYFTIDSNELVVNNGYIRAMRMCMGDSIEIRRSLGGMKFPLYIFNIDAVQDYNLSIDLRSVSLYQRSINRDLAIWTKSNGVINFWGPMSKIVNYIPPKDSSITDLFVVKRQRVFFDAKNRKVTSVKEADINSVIQINIFSDLVGIQEDQPNGLLQAEGSFYTPLFKYSTQKRFSQHKIYFLDHLIANVKFSKIENKLRYLDASQIKGGTNITFIPSFQLLQYANLEAAVKVSAFEVESYKRDFNIYPSIGILRTGLRDTIFQVNGNDTTRIPRTYNVYTLRKTIEANLKIKATSYMGVDLGFSCTWLTLLDSDIKQSGGNFSRTLNTYSEFVAHKNILINPQFQIYYMPDRDESKRIYLRGAFYHDIGTKSNSFLNIQVGVASDINKFLKFKSQN